MICCTCSSLVQMRINLFETCTPAVSWKMTAQSQKLRKEGKNLKRRKKHRQNLILINEICLIDTNTLKVFVRWH